MSKRNAHDTKCAQDMHRVIRDRDVEVISTPTFTPGVVRVRGTEQTRIGRQPQKRTVLNAAEVRERLGLPSR